jgi:hypothetical protein
MSEPVICKKCGSGSYNESGQTHLACWDCYLKAVERAEKAEDKILSMEMVATEKEDQNKEILAMLEELEALIFNKQNDCHVCDGWFRDGHTNNCTLGNLLAKVRGK